MQLSRRPSIYSLPSYSLTGDLLGYLRCGLQYRYTRIGRLPSTRPIQMYFGQFIHGVLEESYRRFDAARRQGKADLPPWSPDRIREICMLIKTRLAAQGLYAWDPVMEELADERAEKAINELGPELFPLIYRAEVRLTGARPLPTDRIPQQYLFREADRYEMVGVVDVITHLTLNDPKWKNNRIVNGILQKLPDTPPKEFEVIIDYKGMRRPPLMNSGQGPSLWDIYGWQVQTYAQLRGTQEDSLPVVAGAVLYLNELLPAKGDISSLRSEIQKKKTDVLPLPGSKTEKLLQSWREGDEPPELPFEFRLSRALRIVNVTAGTIKIALQAFDEVVAGIETCRGKELAEGRVLSTWEKNASDDSTCAACDARTFCAAYSKEMVPRLPGVRVR
jgi:hypothetical protein